MVISHTASLVSHVTVMYFISHQVQHNSTVITTRTIILKKGLGLLGT